MRTTVTIDDDVLTVARSLAARKGIRLGTALSELARIGFRRSPFGNDEEIPVFRVEDGATPITIEDIRKALSEWP